MRIKLAILDLYDNTPNEGMRCIKEIVNYYESAVEWEVFDIRGKAEVPELAEFDIFISTGGPGDPLEGDGIWDKAYYDLIDGILAWNKQENVVKKHVFLICHSFQMVTAHFGLGEIAARKSMSFGTFPLYTTDAGEADLIFDGLGEEFYIADFRSYQVISPDMEAFDKIGARILALEKIRPHIDLERAVMAVRYTPEMVGVQFHPEADPDGMSIHFAQKERKEYIVNTFGIEKFHQMLEDLNDEAKIPLTHKTVLPNFMRHAILQIESTTEQLEAKLLSSVD